MNNSSGHCCHVTLSGVEGYPSLSSLAGACFDSAQHDIAKKVLGILLGMLFSITSNLHAEKPPLQPEDMMHQDRFEWRTLVFNSSKTPPPQSISAIRRAIEQRTTLIIDPQRYVHSYSKATLQQFPFFHIETCTPPPNFLEDHLAFRDFFSKGGSLYLESCASGGFDQQWQEWAQALYPQTNWDPLTRKDALSFSFYLLDLRQLSRYGDGALWLFKQDGRALIIHNQYTHLSWRRFYTEPVSPLKNRPPKEWQLRFYINLTMYLLTGNYKSDQLHLPTILLRRK